MSIKNKVQLVGYVGANPEVKEFGDNQKLAKFSIATNENYKNSSGEWVEVTTWHRLTAWRFLAERVESNIVKGSLVMATGKLVNNSWVDKNGEKQYRTEIELINFMLLNNTKANNEQVERSNSKVKASVADDDLPF